MVVLQADYTCLLKSLPPAPAERARLDECVKRAIAEAQNKVSIENRKAEWEYLLRNDILTLATTEGRALQMHDTNYYNELRDKLDLALTFTENDACEQTFPFIVLQELLETQTIASCSHVFSWIESRAERLTEGMVPQKGKALVLLRTLNDLLRRLSKMGSNTIFCGRILTFLSGVFPLGERSGVNLRGEYGSTWEGVKVGEKSKSNAENQSMAVDETQLTLESSTQVSEGDKMEVDIKRSSAPQTQTEQKEDFYNTFWSLQLPFSKPTVFATKGAFEEFQESVNRVLPVIKEATAKERAMMGSRSGSGHSNGAKRKREPDEETNSNEYFFAKFLTSPDLLDLEIADTHFRRQFLFQLLILLNHLNTFTKTAKVTWATPRNRSLQMEFTLEDADAQWVQDMLGKVSEELRQTTPNGRVFADTIGVILERERNWIKWKNELCTPFDKEPWSVEMDGHKVGLVEATKPIRARLRVAPDDWKWRLGTESLTEIWDLGYTSLDDLKNPFQPGEVKDFVKKIKLEDARISLRKQRLEKLAAMARARAPPPLKPTPPVPTIVVSSDSGPIEMEGISETAPSTVQAPRPVTGSSTSLLHPSLPPKPGTPSKPPATIQESIKPVANAPTPPVPVPTPAPAPPPIVDDEISKFEENKQRWAWLALRTARDHYLQHFGKIGTGDIELLSQEIEKEKEKEKHSKEDDTLGVTGGDEAAGCSPLTQVLEGAEPVVREAETDVKMEG